MFAGSSMLSYSACLRDWSGSRCDYVESEREEKRRVERIRVGSSSPQGHLQTGARLASVVWPVSGAIGGNPRSGSAMG